SMIKIGKTYENFMIDLKATNEKLKDRAIKIVSQIAEVNMADALAMLMKSSWEIKVAIVALKLNTDVAKARLELKKHNGILRKII
ncbi:MAG: N-acetylmuramic acid 6-phosphate etherase, partial [bacterium]|nr:N-acetylmuramic acid 6-phosphate etherase [bacterium]